MGFDGSDFKWQIIVLIGGITLLVIVLIVFLAIFFKKRNKKEVIENKPVIDNNKWVNALGGADNIVSIEAKGSRMIVKLINKDNINKDELHNLGVVSVISSQEKITLVLNEKAENIVNLLK